MGQESIPSWISADAKGRDFQNLDAVQAEMAKKIEQAEAASKPQPLTEMTCDPVACSQGPPAFLINSWIPSIINASCNPS